MGPKGLFSPMLQKLRNKLHRYAAIVRETSNWPTYLAFKAGLHRGRFFTFQMRDGSDYTVEKRMIGPFRECFFDDQYFSRLDLSSFPESPLIIDIGANVGFSALYFFRLFPHAVVHSFEPMPFLQRALHERRANYPGVAWHLHDFGIWKEDGELELFTTHVDDFTSVSGLVRLHDTVHRVKVPVRRLDSFLEQQAISRVDLLKLDCEGAEYGILFSLPETIWGRIANIALETHDTDEWKTRDMVDFLRARGYEVDVEERRITGNVWARNRKG
jgi:FkbM family methyltransferase